jgi:4'-phosphopantetheinyl transferase
MPARRIAEDDVHLWSLALDRPDPAIEFLRGALAFEELARAARLRVSRTSARFIVARAGLRQILGAYLDCDPPAVRLSYGPSGKPAIASSTFQDLRFNLSHSEGLALYALARGRAIGIDLELVRPGGADDAIAVRYFSPEEAAALRATSGGEARDRLFFRCWTRREAYLKAAGVGLAAGAPGRLPPGIAAVVKEDAGEEPTVIDGPDGRRWTVLDIDPSPDFVGALVIEGAGVRITRGVWPLRTGMDRQDR